MRRIAIEDVKPGMKLARTLYYPSGAIMLRAGKSLTGENVRRLDGFGFSAVFIHDKDTEDVLVYDFLDDEERQALTKNIRSLYDGIKQETADLVKTSDISEFTNDALSEKLESKEGQKMISRVHLPQNFFDDCKALLDRMLTTRDFALSVGSIRHQANYLFDHAIEVTVTSLVVARQAGFERAELEKLASGCLLHDIGYVLLPEDLMNKKSPLTSKEEEAMKQHALLGYYLLRGEKVAGVLPPHVAFQHHEWQDGSGYPRGLKGSNRICLRRDAAKEAGSIHRYANIAAVVDTYDLLIADRPWKKGVPSDVALHEIRDASGTHLNQEVVNLFLTLMPVYPMGTEVEITEGEYEKFRGVVVKVNPADLEHPVVRILTDAKRRAVTPWDINLARDPVAIRVVPM
jgi:putative nucleotidyltransferase with HDIG domain